ncbi:hypothetical protein CFELI_00665 [Corynebacterium felinum]|uniref:PilZ domain-containing protein n=1 Tax=Corynebacterium felinum TaxID=131318 RepID=A0ABU2B8T9_9CORY|nr:hypothetical protein [Corynebacterium felinum]WJY93789.1 hypothetical protein CFELI_00665 [Corynebacterium felinum]
MSQLRCAGVDWCVGGGEMLVLAVHDLSWHGVLILMQGVGTVPTGEERVRVGSGGCGGYAVVLGWRESPVNLENI